LVPRELFYRALDVLRREGWHRKVAKYASAQGRARWQPLLYHALNSALTACTAADLLGVEERYCRPLFAGMLLHDYTKTRQSFQDMATGKGGEAPSKTLTPGEEEEARRILSQLGLEGWEAETALRVALLNETPARPVDVAAQLAAGPIPGKVRDAAVLGDLLVSLWGYQELSGRVGEILGRYGYRVAYHRVTQVRGVLTQIVHRALTRLMGEKGYRPLIYLADGVVYAGRGARVGVDEVGQALERELASFLQSLDPGRLGEAAFGNIVQTVLKAPELLEASPRAVEGLWSYVEAQRFVASPSVTGGLRGELARRGFRGVELEDVGAKIASAKNLFIVFKELLSVFPEHRGEAVKRLAEKLGVEPGQVEPLLQIGNTTKAGLLVDLLYPFLEKTGLLSLDHGDMVERLLSAMKAATRGFEAGGEAFTREAGMLVEELYLWVDGEPVIVPRPVKPVYEKGKSGGVELCFLCGRPAEHEAVASLTGDGAESFHNLRAGGERSGGRNKAKICRLCRLEATLRSALGFRPDAYDVYYLMPAIAMSPQYASHYWSAVSLALLGGGELSLHSPAFWRKYLDGLSPAEVARNPLSLHEALGTRAAARERLAGRLRELFGSLDLLREYGVEAGSWEEAAEKVLRGEADPGLLRDLAAVSTGGDYAALLASGNYMVVMARAPGGRDEAEASKMLRRLNRALMLYKMFHAFVYVPGEKMAPFPEPRPLGAAKVPLKADLASLLRERGVVLREGWVGFEEEAGLPAEELSEALTAAELLVEEMRRRRVDFGNAGLLPVLERPPGMLLSRLVAALPGNPLGGRNLEVVRVFLRYLDVLEERWWM